MNFRGLLISGFRYLTGRPVPISVGCTLTHRCNMYCGYCDFPGQVVEEMDTESWKDALGQFARAGTIRFGFAGGEPLLRDDTPELIAHAAALGTKTTLCTNGILVPERIGELKPLDIYTTSLDGADPAIHDAQRKLPGSFDKALRGIEAALSAEKEVKTLTVLTPRNVGQVPGILDLADKMGFRAGFQPATGALLASREVSAMAPPVSEFRETARFLLDAKRKGRNVLSTRGALERMLEYPTRDGEGQCSSAGKYFCYIDPRGKVFPCHIVYDPRPGVHPDGRERGYVEAFRNCTTGCAACPGCYIVPLTEMNLLFKFDPSSVWEQVRSVLLPV